MDKRDIVTTIIEHFERRITDTRKQIESTRGLVRDAPGSNVSHSDTSRFQLGNLELGLQGQVLEHQEVIRFLKELPNKTFVKIQSGAVFSVLDTDGVSKAFFVVAKGGGVTVTMGDITVTTVSIQAPLARAYIGKEIGDDVEINGKVSAVIDVQ